MDISLGTISAFVRLNLTDLKKDQEKVSRNLKDFSKRLTKEVADSATSLGQTLSLGVTAPLLALGRASVNAAKDLDSLKRGLTAVSGSSAEAERQLKRLKVVAALPGLSFEQAVEGSTRLQAAGFSAQLAERSLKAFGNALATVGKGSAELSGVNLALSQIQSKGKVSAEEINQIAERVPQIRKIMIQAFGTADTEILQRAKITSQQFIQAIVGELEKLPKVTGGVANSFENFNDTMRASLAEIGKAILPDLLRAMKSLESGVKSFVGWWKQLDDGTRQNIVRFAAFAAAAGPVMLALGSMANAVLTLAKAFGALRFAALGARGGILGVIAAGSALAIGKVVNDLTSASKNSGPNAAARDAAEQKANPRSYFQNQINSARLRMQGANPNTELGRQIIANNQAMIERAGVQMFQSLSPKAAAARAAGGGGGGNAAQDALLKQLRAQIAGVGSGKGGGGGGAAKAEAAARRALTEKAQREELEFRRIKKIEKWNEDWWNATFKEWVELARAQAEWDEDAQKAFEKADALDFAKGLRDIKDRANLLEDAGALLRQIAQETAASEASQRKAGGAAMGGAFGGFNSAMGMLSPMAAKAAEVTAAKQIALTDKLTQHQVQMGQISLTAYEQYLSRRLQEVRGNVEEEIRIEAELQNTRFALWEEAERKRYRGWQNLARGMENAFANAFANVLDGGKNLFQSLLDAFKQMLVQMVAQAVAAGLVRSLFGGGNFLTGFLSVFGFDNGGNDRKAYRWGKDFSHHFTSGAVDYSRTAANRGRSALSGAGAGPVNVQVSFGPVTINNGMDIQTVSEQLGKATQDALRRRVR